MNTIRVNDLLLVQVLWQLMILSKDYSHAISPIKNKYVSFQFIYIFVFNLNSSYICYISVNLHVHCCYFVCLDSLSGLNQIPWLMLHTWPVNQILILIFI